jgi:hypothetical protein|tara:strand:+ start:117 stop:566 length:450 start_codon:yes stop_codon:yes gene_type:complete
MMRAETQQRQYSERTLQQVRLDGVRALSKAKFCPKNSEIVRLSCVDDRAETDSQFGNQLWYFEAKGVDEGHHRQDVFGVIEYQIQFGLQELVEDGVFDTPQEREGFRSLYDREVSRPSWRHPANRLLLAAMIAMAALTLFLLTLKNLLA